MSRDAGPTDRERPPIAHNAGDSAGDAASTAAVAAYAAVSVRRGAISLARRLRLERSAPSLTALELGVLGHLHRRGALTPGDLAAYERVQPQSLTRTLAELERTDLVSRQSDPSDGRRSLLVITDAGVTALRAEMAERDAWLAGAMTARLTSTEIELLRLAGPLLEQLAEAQIMIP